MQKKKFLSKLPQMAHCASDVSFNSQSSILFFVDSKRLSYLILKSRRCCVPLNGPFKTAAHRNILWTYTNIIKVFYIKILKQSILILCNIPAWSTTGFNRTYKIHVTFMENYYFCRVKMSICVFTGLVNYIKFPRKSYS